MAAVLEEERVDGGRGKGRIRPRGTRVDSGKGIRGGLREEGASNGRVPRLDILPHCDLEGGEQANDPRRRFPEEMLDGRIGRYDTSNHVGEQRGLREIRIGSPAVLRRTPFLAGLVSKWDLNDMSVSFASSKREWRVLCSEAAANRFIVADDSKNIFGTCYHVREPETQKMHMKVHGFVGCMRQWTRNSVMLWDTVMTADDSVGSNGLSQEGRDPAVAAAPLLVAGIGEAAAADLQTRLRWDWMRTMLNGANFGAILGVDLKVSNRNALQPIRYDAAEQMICQVTGRTRVLICAPEESYRGLYPYPAHHTYDKYSMVDFDEADLGKWPNFVRARGKMCVLEPGDILYVPRLFWCQLHTLSADAITLTLRVDAGRRTRSSGMIHPMLGRVLEERVAKAEGVEHARHWLDVIARGNELDTINLSTVQGLRRLDMAQMVRDEIDFNLGRGQWATFLQELISGRLVPTPWLNQNFREKLYLQDKPVIVEDTRTEVELQFPELFREKLEREGYKVEKTKSTIPIPGVNVPRNFGQ